jgi:hypothetical protein
MSGPIRYYVYFGPNSGEMPMIGHIYNEGPDDPRVRAVVLELVSTTDLEQAERWRSILATGKLPNLAADPPIVDEEQVSARIAEIPIESGEISID